MDEIRILIVDDSKATRLIHERYFKDLYEDSDSSQLVVRLAATAKEMFNFLRAEKFHLILLDWDLGEDENMQQIDGINLIPDILGIRPNSRVLVITSSNDAQLAVKAMQNGAMDFVTKGNSQQKEEKILRAIEAAQFEIESLHRNFTSTASGYICKSDAMKMVDLQLNTLCGVHTPVLILGESGLGKTHAAKRLNELSKIFYKQNQRPFVLVDINTINEELIESEFFGHEKGSFTGAHQVKQGLFELASGGDILVDEIGDASLKLQGRFLKVIEEKTFRRVGGQQDIKTDARVIFATNKDLKKMVLDERFKSDLYARIRTITINMPSLNERKEDIPHICEGIAKELGDKHEKTISYNDFPPSLKRYFQRDNIPFNIRGIKSDIEQLIIYCPQRRNGKIDFNKWKHILGNSLDRADSMEIEDISSEKSEDINQLMDLIASRLLSGKEKNMSLYSLKATLEEKVCLAANKKYPKQKDIAKALGLQRSAASIKIRRYLSKEREENSTESDKIKEQL